MRFTIKWVRSTLSRMTMKSTRRVLALLGYALHCSLVCSHQSLIRLLCNSRFARALHCAYLLEPLTLSRAREKVNDKYLKTTWFCPLVHWRRCVAEAHSLVSRCLIDRTNVTEKRLREIWEDQVPKRHKKKHASHVDLFKALTTTTTKKVSR